MRDVGKETEGLTRATIEQIVSEIECMPYELFVRELDIRFLNQGTARLYLQVRQQTTNTETGEPYEARGRKWVLSRHMTQDEIVQTALLAVIKFSEHEVREAFKWRGRAIFNTHLDIEVLWENADKTSTREPRNNGHLAEKGQESD